VEKNGRKYLMTEIETGLMNFEEAEITRRGDVILLPVKEKADKNGKSQKKP
jgi:hypothetical protein